MTEPTDEQIIKCLAEFEGWTELEGGRAWFPHRDKDSLPMKWPYQLPDYLNDLNAMHSIEDELEQRDLNDKYLDAMGPIIDPNYQGPFGWDAWPLLHATARQRALAAYRVITNQEQ